MERLLQNNEPRLVKAGNKNICIVKLGTDLIAFENECPHMREGLNGGTVNYLKEIVCPLHTYKFNLKTGEEEKRRCSPLQFIKIEIMNKEVFLDLESKNLNNGN
jgi:nitrite reductase/ring-hydroxylating ferredoxin subunit